MNPFQKSWYRDWRFWSVAAWFAFTLVLAIWQMIFSSQTLSQLSSLNPSEAATLARHARMVQMESITMLVMLSIGGIALTLLLRRERVANRRLREFFATFTHELKTSLASLRIQAEVLQEVLAKMGSGQRAERVLADLTRIEMQLENSLALARGEDDRLLKEQVSLKELLLSLQHSFALPIHLNRDCALHADRRVVESMLKNIAQNSALHGKAQNLFIDVQAEGSRVLVSIEDDGTGSAAPAAEFGRLFSRPTSGSRNGIGLYLVRRFAERMGGTARFTGRGRRGFRVELLLEGAVR